VSIIVFAVVRFIPGDPVGTMAQADLAVTKPEAFLFGGLSPFDRLRANGLPRSW